MKGVILCAGRATRLYPLTHSWPKALLPMANRPLLAYLLEALAGAGIREAAVVVNPAQARLFTNALPECTPPGLQVTLVEQHRPQGLAHAVACTRSFVEESPVAVLLGDNLFTWSLSPFAQRFLSQGLDALLMVMAVPDPQRYGVAVLAGRQVVEVEEKPAQPRSPWAIAGLYFFTPAIFDAIKGLSPSARGELELTDAIRRLIQAGYRVEADPVPGWCQDVGTVESFLEGQWRLLESLTPAHGASQVSATSRLEGPVRLGAGTVVADSVLTGPVLVGEGCRVVGSQLGPYTVVGDGCRIVGSTLQRTVVLPGAAIEGLPWQLQESLVGHRALLRADGRCGRALRLVVGDDTRLLLSGRWEGPGGGGVVPGPEGLGGEGGGGRG